MAEQGQKRKSLKTQRFYDRIADVHNVALKLNGYRRSVAKYLRSLALDLDENSRVLDAGSGTGIVTLGFVDSKIPAALTVAFDLSYKSLKVARNEIKSSRSARGRTVVPTQGNVLSLPFADDTFDLVLTCGVLEYVPLDDGLRELSRVLKPGAKLVFIPVKPSIVGSVLEFLYKFKIHPLEKVREVAQDYFTVVGNHNFPVNEPIGWSKTIFLLEKKS